MKRILPGLFFIFIFVSVQSQPVKIMLVTGGHAFDTIQFFDMFDALPGIEYKHFQQPKANQGLVRNSADEFDVLVFYDMWKTISETEKSAYLRLAEKGKPFLFFRIIQLHHIRTGLSLKNCWEENILKPDGEYQKKSNRTMNTMFGFTAKLKNIQRLQSD